MARKPDVPCSRCGTLGWRGRGSAPADLYVCRSCRRDRCAPSKPDGPHALKQAVCLECQGEFASRSLQPKYCSRSCANRGAGKARAMQPESSKTRHDQRCSAAPGLTYTQRVRLLNRWKRQRRVCIYCPSPATTMDHVIPLIRGGTNYEGNLAPACKRCNSSKGGKLTTEWLTGRRCTRTLYVLASPPRTRKPKLPRAPLADRSCSICAEQFMPKARTSRYCSSACQWEHNARSARERYRAKVGLPPTWDVPTTPQLRRAS